MKDKYGTDSLRYFLMREMVVGLDADFSETAFLKRHNYDLANDLGNLANRLVKFAERSMGGVVPEPGAGSGMPHDADLQAMALALPGRVRDLVGDLRVEQAVEATIALVRRVNRYVAETEPFKVIKTDPAAAAGAVWMALEALRFALNCLWPVMPAKCEALLVAIGAGKPEATLDALAWGGLKPGGAMVLESAPFPRFDVPEYEAAPEVAPAAVVAPAPVVVPVAVAAKPAPSDEPPARIAFPDFAKVDLRIGTVLVAEPVTGSDKLLRLQVDLGEAQPRQIVAGIGKAYAPADLVGRQIVVVANLEPRKVFGQLSNGMVLAASDDAGPAVLSPARPIPPGTKVS